MQTKAVENWAGLTAIAWMTSVFALIQLLIVPQHLVVGPFWLWIVGLLALQLLPGFILAVIGFRSMNRLGRIAAVAAIGLFLWFVWYGVVPVASVVWQLQK